MKQSTTYYLLFLTAIAICMAVLSSCSPKARMTRLCTKHPEVCRYDTSYTDTIVTHRSVIDSSFVTNRQDTIMIERYGVRTQIIRSYDTLHIEQSKTDTLIKTELVRSVIVKEKNKVPLWLVVLSVMFVVYWIGRVITTYFESKL
jgi:hypothetical protein